MRTFTLIAAAAAVAFGLATAPAMADSYSPNHSTTAHKTPKQYGGSGYSQGHKYGSAYGSAYGNNQGNNQGYGYKRRHYDREGDRPGYHRDNRLGWPKFGFGRPYFGYQQYGYNAPRLSKVKLIHRLKRQRFSRVKRITFSHGFYNVFARDRYGRKVKLKVDPYTGRIVARRYLG